MNKLKDLQNKIDGESVKQIVRRILRLESANAKLSALEVLDDNARESYELNEQQIDMLREEVFIRLYNKGLIDDWTDFDGLTGDEDFGDFFKGIQSDALWVLGNGDWC